MPVGVLVESQEIPVRVMTRTRDPVRGAPGGRPVQTAGRWKPGPRGFSVWGRGSITTFPRASAIPRSAMPSGGARAVLLRAEITHFPRHLQQPDPRPSAAGVGL